MSKSGDEETRPAVTGNGSEGAQRPLHGLTRSRRTKRAASE